MGSLFFNKLAAALLAIALVVLGLTTLGDSLFHVEQPEEYGYPVDLAALENTGAAEEEEEGPVDFGLLLASADVSAGERVARRCASCHTFDSGMADGTGPHLYGVLGRAVAAVDGFNYSGAMQEYATTTPDWHYENLYNFLENPRRYIPGTAMSFAGLRDQEDRINLIAYMHEQGSSDMPFPEPLATPAEEAEMAEGDMNEEADADSVAMDDAVEPEMMDEGDAAAPASEAEEPAAEPQPEEGDDQ
ncbi:MAG: cytochrome c, membrane-bound [Oceanicaulis sp.]|jgi:cytochrome c|uniref:c-type cytochrome n=1 Tax=unclassified Oceanicaulis TaxID=2632123 RepID=UPI000C4DA890|nr:MULTISPECIES: cytochrome c family protein [unclassified Oceanicaulis]MAB69376.1 cytochrome c, membrane-bound [Oceanicaulis sp.]MBC40146.1 cytochrome c, membrane-bound [Oceanicaulis sp.]MBG36969.1 cytochrome c, membrane-bound [Oceanicaulis sp.]HBU61225.1 cytochrome c family protein [Oceanicaulis sp.]HCR94652.1 cytochrome c family protein [Oceanicaulis sp.]|tara:strand:- start:2338 stop:3075 length:738 start_codon:yes stop_codon:yes gene_type:complete